MSFVSQQFLFSTVVALIVLALGFGCGVAYNTLETSRKSIIENRFCAYYSNEKVGEIPARCLPYFMGVRVYKNNGEVI